MRFATLTSFRLLVRQFFTILFDGHNLKCRCNDVNNTKNSQQPASHFGKIRIHSNLHLSLCRMIQLKFSNKMQTGKNPITVKIKLQGISFWVTQVLGDQCQDLTTTRIFKFGTLICKCSHYLRGTWPAPTSWWGSSSGGTRAAARSDCSSCASQRTTATAKSLWIFVCVTHQVTIRKSVLPFFNSLFKHYRL